MKTFWIIYNLFRRLPKVDDPHFTVRYEWWVFGAETTDGTSRVWIGNCVWSNHWRLGFSTLSLPSRKKKSDIPF